MSPSVHRHQVLVCSISNGLQKKDGGCQFAVVCGGRIGVWVQAQPKDGTRSTTLWRGIPHMVLFGEDEMQRDREDQGHG